MTYSMLVNKLLFTIQNVSIKSVELKSKMKDLLDLQYKMFLLNL